jgi:hypothetical protein
MGQCGDQAAHRVCGHTEKVLDLPGWAAATREGLLERGTSTLESQRMSRSQNEMGKLLKSGNLAICNTVGPTTMGL